MRISLLPASVLALSVQGALAGTVPQQARALATRQDFEAGYNAAEGTWTGSLSPDGDVTTLHGSLEEVISQAEAISNPGSTAEIAKRGGDDWRNLVVAKKECYGGGELTSPQKYIQQAIDQINSREGNVRLEQPGCQRVGCASKLEITVCWEPVEGAPTVYEKPWSYVADYATGVLQEWCPKAGPYTIMPFIKSWVGGKVWDPAGLAVDIHRMPDDVC